MSQTVPVKCSSIRLFLLRPFKDSYQLLLLQRNGGKLDGDWLHIAGGIEEGETAWQAAIREAWEETGIELTELYSADYCEQYYLAASNVIALSPVFVAYIDASTEVKLNDEHKDYRWVSPQEARKCCVFPTQRQGLKKLEEDFILENPPQQLRINIHAMQQ